MLAKLVMRIHREMPDKLRAAKELLRCVGAGREVAWRSNSHILVLTCNAVESYRLDHKLGRPMLC